MKNFKGTPGPWVVNDNGHYLEIGKTIRGDIAEVGPSQHYYDNGDRNGPITTANANLIAAAPELLEALQRIVKEAENPKGELYDLLSAIDEAKPAINKALGGE